jgi:hypothetical protein
MGYRQRERKRRMKRVAAGAAQRQSRENASAAARHWLTVVTERCCCNECAGILAVGRECVYRHTPREILCIRCAQRQSISYRPSLRWEKESRARRKQAA